MPEVLLKNFIQPVIQQHKFCPTFLQIQASQSDFSFYLDWFGPDATTGRYWDGLYAIIQMLTLFRTRRLASCGSQWTSPNLKIISLKVVAIKSARSFWLIPIDSKPKHDPNNQPETHSHLTWFEIQKCPQITLLVTNPNPFYILHC